MTEFRRSKRNKEFCCRPLIPPWRRPWHSPAQQRWSYGELHTIPQLAAAYAEAIVRAHPFSDGNKRSGFLVAVVLMIQRLAAGELPWEELEAWFAGNSVVAP